MIKRIFSKCWLYLLLFSIVFYNLTGCAFKNIHRSHVKREAIIDKVIKTAQSQVGVCYVSGGTTPRGFDCSGLIWWAYKKHGIDIPRLSEHQAKAGISIKKHAVKPGDIIVFKTYRGRTGLHTGMYIGNGQFIHSSTKGKRVRHDHMENKYWKKKFFVIRRIIN